MGQTSERPPEPKPKPKPKPSRLAKHYRRRTFQARVWEREQLAEAGLADVAWDAKAYCPWCRSGSGDEPPPKK